ncbi:MAG TPA: hypothetical protein VFG63_10375 [Nocardioidaceae bacterium]|nr:hypothetical protein [Nocardioidaceae bacterium]
MRASAFDPVRVLGCSADEAEQLLRGKRVTPGEVESVALHHYPWRRHLHDPTSYWVTASQAAMILRMSPQQVKHLLDEDRLAHVVHASGVRLMRREQIENLRDRSLADSGSAGHRSSGHSSSGRPRPHA